jgi:hypothetical protein
MTGSPSLTDEGESVMDDDPSWMTGCHGWSSWTRSGRMLLGAWKPHIFENPLLL